MSGAIEFAPILFQAEQAESSFVEFLGDIGLYQRRVAECPGGAAQRMAVLQSLSLETGHSALDVGCGGGHLVREFALAVGHGGRAVGLDVSREQVTAAKDHCAGLENARCVVGSATDLNMEDASFDRLAAIRTLEYVDDVPSALAEMRRVLKPGGVAALVSVLWDHFRFHGPDPGLNERLIDAFRAHCPHQMLPMALPRMLSESGFVGSLQWPVTLFERSLNDNSYAFWVSKVVAAFAVGQGISRDDAEVWLQQLQQADNERRFGFVSMPVLTVTCAPA